MAKLVYAVLLWVIGFVWGSIVFMTPALKTVSAIPYVSSNSRHHFPILFIWLIATYLIAKSHLKTAGDRAGAGLKLGLVFVVVNVVLDLAVLVLLLKAGFTYFVSLSVWSGYVILFIVPFIAGRSSLRTDRYSMKYGSTLSPEFICRELLLEVCYSEVLAHG